MTTISPCDSLMARRTASNSLASTPIFRADRSSLAPSISASTAASSVPGRMCMNCAACSRRRIERFVDETRTADHSERVVTVGCHDRIDLLRGKADRFVPGRGNQLPAFLVTNHRRANTLFMIHERMAKAALDAEELAV